MSQRNPTVTPLILGGGSIMSGTPSTGQIRYTHGGFKQESRYSGVATDVRLQLGAGRLESAQLLPGADFAASGLPIIFYDAAVAATNGPIAASGHKIVGVLAPSNTASGNVVTGERRTYHTPYTSGLCVSQISGNPGWTCNFSPVVSGNTGGIT